MMKKKELEELRNGFQEIINCINELLEIDDENKEEKEQKLVWLIYKLMKMKTEYLTEDD